MKNLLYLLFLTLMLLSSCNFTTETADSNVPPVVTISEGDATVDYGATQVFTAVAKDEDGDNLTYQWYIDDVLQINETNSTFSISKTPKQPTVYTIKVVVDDGHTEVQAEVMFTVYNLGVSILEGDVSVEYGVEQIFTAEVNNVHSDNITYQWYVNDELQTGETGSTFSITRTPDQLIVYTIKVIVSDGINTIEDVVTFSVNGLFLGFSIVVELPELLPIVFDGQVLELQSGETMTVSLSSSTDVDIDYYTWYVDLNVVSEGNTNNSITFGDTLETGIHKLTIQIEKNGFLYSEELLFTVVI